MPSRPACLVTGTVSDYRREPFRLLAQGQDVEVIAFEEAGAPVPGLTVHRTSQAGAVRLAGSGRYRAVISSLGGRLALPGSYAAARMRGVPFVLWATIWDHPSTLAHRLSRRPTEYLYRHADAVATYGPHVSAHVAAARSDRATIFEAPQAVDNAHFGAAVPEAEVAAARERVGAGEGPLILFVGRLEAEKGVPVLLEAWERAAPAGATLALAGGGPLEGGLRTAAYPGVRMLGRLGAGELPALYAAADALVLPSIRTETFTEPWGLVVNEAMNQSTPVIASDSVGAAAGGLVVHGRNGLVVPAGDAGELARALRELAGDPALRTRMGAAAREDVAAYTPLAWARGMSRALQAAGAPRERGRTCC